MKRHSHPLATLASALALALACAAPLARAADPANPPASPNDFIAPLAGEWTVVNEVSLAPDQPKMKVEFRESSRTLGDNWLIANAKGDLMGTPFESLLTLGHDSAQSQFVCTYIDSMQRRMWTFTGQFDDAGKRLILECDGPAFDDPAKTTKYRLIVEHPEPNQKITRSQAILPNGEWFEFETTTYTRAD